MDMLPRERCQEMSLSHPTTYQAHDSGERLAKRPKQKRRPWRQFTIRSTCEQQEALEALINAVRYSRVHSQDHAGFNAQPQPCDTILANYLTSDS